MKIIVTITSGTLSGRNFELSNGFLTVGRSENCSIRFDPLHEKIASKQHAFIEAKPDGFYLMDNSSTNGTLINGERIASAKLSNGDVIQFGKNGVTAKVDINDGAGGVIDPTVQFGSGNVPGAPQSGLAPPNPAYNDFQMPAPMSSKEPSVELRKSITSIGLGNLQAVQPETSRTGKYIGAGIAIFSFVFLGLIVVGLLVWSLGATQIGIVPAVIVSIIAAVVAFIPAIFYLMPLVWLDRFDPEPIWILASAFAWGAIVSVFVSFIINTLVMSLFGREIGAVLSAPIIEEASKGIGLLILLLVFRKYFDGILDGVIFAGVIALGFATVENVQYYGSALIGGGVKGIGLTFLVRGVFSPFAHVTFTAMTGIGCGIARESHNTLVRIAAPIAGYSLAVFLHFLWNAVATFIGFGGFALMYFVLEVPFFLIIVGFIIYIMIRQNRILKEMLAIDVARGLITQDNLDITTSGFRSFTWTLGGIASGKYFARKKFVRAIGKLGLSYWHIQRATAAQGQTASFQQNPILREEVLRYRDQV